MTVFWLILMINCIMFEVATVGLVCIWFAGGALVACFLALANVHVVIQVTAFLVVSFTLVVITKPLAKEWVNKDRVRTNYEGIIGKVVRITERVDNINETGTALVNGQEWTARSDSDDVILEEGDIAQVVNISGVKLIVKKYQD